MQWRLKMSMTLYQLSEQFREACQLPEEILGDTLDGIQGAIEVKAKNIGAFVLNLEVEERAIRDYIERMKDRLYAAEKRRERLTNYLLTNMQACGITEISSPEFTLKVAKNPVSVVIDNENLLEEKFMKITVTKKPSKAEIKKALEDGENVNGAHLEQGQRLVIK
jgi:hypothetical protein